MGCLSGSPPLGQWTTGVDLGLGGGAARELEERWRGDPGPALVRANQARARTRARSQRRGMVRSPCSARSIGRKTFKPPSIVTSELGIVGASGLVGDSRSVMRRFTIPLQRDDLLSVPEADASDSAYRVGRIYSIRDLAAQLQEAQVDFEAHGCAFITRERHGGGSNFDVCFSALTHFHKDLSPGAKHKALELVQAALGDLAQKLDRELTAPPRSADSVMPERAESRGTGSPGDRLRRSGELKMLLYLFTQIIEMLEANETSSSELLVAKAKAKRLLAAGAEGPVWDPDRKASALLLLYRLVHLPLAQLFEPPRVEEEIINALANCLFRMLENPSIALQRQKDLRASIFQIMGVLCAQHGYLLSCRLKIVQSLRHFEHLGSPLAEGVAVLARDFACSPMIMEIVRDLSHIDPSELQRDTSATRAYGTFLTELTEALPEMMKPCLSLLTMHLDGPSPSLRKCVLTILGEITLQVFGGAGPLEEAERETRDQFLDCLEEHIHDIHAHVRTSVLQIWAKLCSAKAIPLSRQQRLLKLVIGRLHDKSSNVRKQAVQLLTALLQCNPYRASMPVEELKEELEKESNKLATLQPLEDDPEDGEAEKNANFWATIQAEVLDAVEIPMTDETNAETLWKNASRNEVVLRIKHLLTKKKHGRAVTLLRSALEEFPNDDIFLAREPEQMEADHLYHMLKAITLFVPTLPENHDQTDLDEEVGKQKIVVAYLQDSYGFAQLLNQALPTVAVLLGSKYNSDIMEAIQFFVSAFEFGVLNAMVGVRKMLSLIWSQETSVREAVLNAYRRLYVSEDTVSPKEKAQTIVRNFIALIIGATVGEMTSLEELVGMLVKSKDIRVESFNLLWQYFTMMIPTVTPDESRCAIVMLGMIASVEPTVLTTNLGLIIDVGFGKRGKDDLRLVNDICGALTKLAYLKGTSSQEDDLKAFPGLKFAATHELFVGLEEHLLAGLTSQSNAYVPMSQKAITVIYQLAEHPDKIAERVLKKLAAETLTAPEAPISIKKLTRLFAVVGHVALAQLNHLEVSILNELKRRKTLREVQKEKTSRKSIGSKRKGSSKRESVKGEDGEDNLEVMGAEADDAEIEFIRHVCEQEVVSSPECLLTQFLPLVLHVVGNPHKYNDPHLRASAGLALSKLMLVSSEVCEEHLQLLFTLMEKSKEDVIRANLIIATGDLSFRFPNTLEPWTPRMYARLRDESTLVRSNTLNVLTLLILNDMIKVKGQISDMALCIDDGNDKISGLAKQFFSELARKGNALYNVMPDIISRLSDVGSGVGEDKFRTILAYIVALIDKDKHLESLVEKLCHRFRATQSSRQWRDLSYCLALFSFNEKALKKLQDNISCYSDKLHEDAVYNAFSGILVQARKNVKQESKIMIEEIEDKLANARTKCLEDYGASSRAVAAKEVGDPEAHTKENHKMDQEDEDEEADEEDSA